jgi:hypothetical protein
MRFFGIGGVDVCPPKAKATLSNRVGCASSVRQQPRQPMRLQAGCLTLTPGRWLPPQNIENNPIQSSRRSPAPTLLSRYLTRQISSIASSSHQSVKRPQSRNAVRRDIWRNSLTYNRTLRCDTFNASMRSYSAWVPMKTIYRRESNAATKREFLPGSRVVGLRTGAGRRRLVVEP